MKINISLQTDFNRFHSISYSFSLNISNLFQRPFESKPFRLKNKQSVNGLSMEWPIKCHISMFAAICLHSCPHRKLSAISDLINSSTKYRIPENPQKSHQNRFSLQCKSSDGRIPTGLGLTLELTRSQLWTAGRNSEPAVGKYRIKSNNLITNQCTEWGNDYECKNFINSL